MLKYKFEETPKIRRLLIKAEALKMLFAQARALPYIEENLRRESLLKSALFSARVEGNPLSLEKIKFASEEKKTKDLKKIEVFNLLRTYKFIYRSRYPSRLNLSLIKKLHQMTMKNISANAGKLRRDPWAIYNQAGVVVYLTPSPSQLPKLMDEFIQLSQDIKYEIPVKAAILQFVFEKIHPFADGNGRVGRLISTFIMNRGEYHFRDLISPEEIVDKKRENYYQALEPFFKTTLFVEFFLESLVEQAGSVLAKLGQRKEESPEDSLLPRRQEILAIIKDHPYCSFDFIVRRFSAINPKTLHYDFSQLQRGGFIIKAGKTRGVRYKARE